MADNIHYWYEEAQIYAKPNILMDICMCWFCLFEKSLFPLQTLELH